VQTVFTVLAAKFILFQAICHRFASVAKKDDSAGRIIYLGGQRGFYLFSFDFMNYLQFAHVFFPVGSYFPVVNDFVDGIWLKLRFELFSLPIFHLISYTLYKES